MTDYEAEYAARLAVWQDEAIARIQRKVAAEGSTVVVSGLGIYGSVHDLRADLLTLRERIAIFGREQVAAELGRQGVGNGMAER